MDSCLPGLELPDSVAPRPLVDAVMGVISNLPGDNRSAHIAMAYTLASIIEDKKRSGKTSTVAHDLRLLLELMNQLVGADVAAGDGADQVRQAIAEWGEFLKAVP